MTSTARAPTTGDYRNQRKWLGEIDELMDKVFTVGSISHKAFVSCLPMPEARDYLTKENEVAAWKQ